MFTFLQINMNDRDNGILLGKWLSQGDNSNSAYSDGVPPNLWAGSEAIMSQYTWSKFKTGQVCPVLGVYWNTDYR